MYSFKRPPWRPCERTCVMCVIVASQGRSLRSYVEAHQKHWGTESHFTFQIANNDQIAQMHLSCSQATKSGVFFCVEAHMMLKPRLPCLRLATRLHPCQIYIGNDGMLRCLD